MNTKNWLGRVLAGGLLLASAGAYAQSGCVMTSHVPRNGVSIPFGPTGSGVTVSGVVNNTNSSSTSGSFTDGLGRTHSASVTNGYRFEANSHRVTWTFSPAVPAHRIGVAISDMGGVNYQFDYYGAKLRLTVTGTATRADFEVLRNNNERLGVYDPSTGIIGKDLDGPAPTQSHGAFLRGTSDRLVSTLQIAGEDVYPADWIYVNLFSIPTCVTVRKATEYGTGAFDFGLSSNLKNFASSASASSTSLTTTVDSPTSFVYSRYFHPDEALTIAGTGTNDVVITETSVPSSYWKLKSVSCTDWNSSRTGSTGTFGSVVNGAITIPGNRVRFESNIVCDYVNQQQVANVQVVKTNASNGSADSSTDALKPDGAANYTIVATNPGPLAADGALVRDVVASGLSCSAAQCTGTTGGAVCPATTLASLTGSGVTVATFPANSTVSFLVSCTTPATGP